MLLAHPTWRSPSPPPSPYRRQRSRSADALRDLPHASKPRMQVVADFDAAVPLAQLPGGPVGVVDSSGEQQQQPPDALGWLDVFVGSELIGSLVRAGGRGFVCVRG